MLHKTGPTEKIAAFKGFDIHSNEDYQMVTNEEKIMQFTIYK